VVALDPELGMLANAHEKAAAAPVRVTLVAGSAEALPFPDEAFDTVVATLVFCTIADPAAAMAEVERVLSPGGRVLMLEHIRSSNAALGFLMDIATPVQRIVAAGCHLNRATQALVARAGFRIETATRRFRGTILELEAVRLART